MYVALWLMPIKKIAIKDFIEQASKGILLDVRSPGEYLHAQIPGAISLPVFTDEERKVVGTAYKQQGRQPAIKLGIDYWGAKMKTTIEEVEKIIAKNAEQLSEQIIYLYCWRGGMRSAAVAWLLDLYGYNVCLLTGGYKAYRTWALLQFQKKYECNIIAGYTGSGKTELLHRLAQYHLPTICLETMASHKGSAFGGFNQPPQPSQEMFENILALALHKNEEKIFFIEDESKRIGALNIPNEFWQTMRAQPVYFIEIPFDERLAYILKEYGTLNKEALQTAILRIKKRLGPQETKTAIQHLEEGNYKDCFKILLHYYDKYYLKALNNRENITLLLNKIECQTVDTISNFEKLRLCTTVNI